MGPVGPAEVDAPAKQSVSGGYVFLPQLPAAPLRMSEVRLRNGQRVIERWDDVFEALSAEPRRQIVVSLKDGREGRTVSLPEMAMNPNAPVDQDDLRLQLRHRHLPKLAAMDFVDWKAEPLVASRGPRFDEVSTVIGALQSNAIELPDSLVVGCQRLESERQVDRSD